MTLDWGDLTGAWRGCDGDEQRFNHRAFENVMMVTGSVVCWF